MSGHDDAVRLRSHAGRVSEGRSAPGWGTWAQLQGDDVAQLALGRLLEIVGEAAGKVSPKYRASHPQLPWAEMAALRNRLAHAYFDVDLDVLVDIVTKDLPPLVEQLERLLPGEK